MMNCGASGDALIDQSTLFKRQESGGGTVAILVFFVLRASICGQTGHEDKSEMINLAKPPILSSMYRQLWHVEHQTLFPPQVRWCNTFGSKLRGLTFRRHLKENEGIVLVETNEGRLTTAVHMLFVFCDLAIIWVNSNGQIVDIAHGQPWRPAYVPSQPAQYVVELHPRWLHQFQPGDHIQFHAL